MGNKFDFSGYATKNDLKCADGRTIRRNAFKDCDGITVPLVWQQNQPGIADQQINIRGGAKTIIQRRGRQTALNSSATV